MGRLTGINKYNNEIGTRISKHGDGAYDRIIKRLFEYEELEEKGMLIKLPCKIGDMIYKVENGEILELHSSFAGVMAVSGNIGEDAIGWEVTFEDLNKTIFLTREEAINSLKNINK